MEDVISPRLRILYGIFLIALGVITAIATYKYIIPIGSIFLIGSGFILIFWKRWNHMIRNIILGNINKEIK